VSSRKSKRSALRELRAWNPHPEKVKAPLFASHAFFDPEDKAQVKYEMLRRREVETAPLEETCHEFGFTRESYRHLLERFRSEGISGIPAWDRTNWHVTARRKSASLLAVAPSTGSWPTRARGKKNGARRSLAPNRGDGFLCWGGDLQDIYERWRQTALLGGDAASFLQWGMTLLAPSYFEGSRRVCQVRRRRASVREGDFSLGSLFSELGIEWTRLRSCPERSFDSMEVRR